MGNASLFQELCCCHLAISCIITRIQSYCHQTLHTIQNEKVSFFDLMIVDRLCNSINNNYYCHNGFPWLNGSGNFFCQTLNILASSKKKSRKLSLIIFTIDIIEDQNKLPTNPEIRKQFSILGICPRCFMMRLTFYLTHSSMSVNCKL